MFKRAINKYFGYSFYTRVTITTLVLAAIFFTIIFCFNGGIKMLVSPNEIVYSNLNEIATDIINRKDTDFLEKLETLKDYKIIVKAKENTIDVTLYGYGFHILNIVLTGDYTILSLNRIHDNFWALVFLFVISCIYILGVSLFYGFFVNLLLAAIKYVYINFFIPYWPEICQYFKDRKEEDDIDEEDDDEFLEEEEENSEEETE